MVSGSEKAARSRELLFGFGFTTGGGFLTTAVKNYRAVSAISREDADYPSRSVKQILLADLW